MNASEVKYDFTLDPSIEGWPDYWSKVPPGRLKLEKVSVRPVGDDKFWVECTYRRPWYMRVYLTIRNLFQ